MSGDRRRILPLALLQISSGMPYGFLITGAFVTYLRTSDVSLTDIGILSLVSLPWNVKFLWAPLVDRFAFGWPDRRRSWVLMSQVMLSLSFIAIAALVWNGLVLDTRTLWMLGGVAFFIALAAATQDIAVDAFAVEYLRPEEQGPASGMRTVFWRVGFLLCSGVAIAAADPALWAKAGHPIGKNDAWPWVFAAIAVLFLPLVVLTIFCPPAEKPAVAPRSLMSAVVEPLTSYFSRPGAIVVALFLIFYKFGDNLSSSMWIPFMVDKGITRVEIGLLNKTLGTVSVLAGVAIGGAAVPKIGLGRALWIFGVVQGLSSAFYGVAALADGARWAVYLAIAGENLAIGLGTPAMLTLCLRLCEKKYGATQYALLSSLFALGRWATGPPAGYIAEKTSYTFLFFFAVLAAVPGLVLLQRIAPLGQREVATAAIPASEPS
ncbi:MAG: MFS transporter [Archangiaceae bacterium]|nr:MFS transporter [Archangiaceae bacterium]